MALADSCAGLLFCAGRSWVWRPNTADVTRFLVGGHRLTLRALLPCDIAYFCSETADLQPTLPALPTVRIGSLSV
jgi:hypothetical protein